MNEIVKTAAAAAKYKYQRELKDAYLFEILFYSRKAYK